MSAKVYCGNAKEISTSYGKMLKLSFSEEDLQKLQDHLDRGWVNANVKERREPSPTGITHFLEIDTWKSDQNNEVGSSQKNDPTDGIEEAEVIDDNAQQAINDRKALDESGDDLPF